MRSLCGSRVTVDIQLHIEAKTRKSFGGHRERETPGPIPNPEAKPLIVDGTARGTLWESRSLPDIIKKRNQCSKEPVPFLFPTEVSILISQNGIDFKEVKTIKNTISPQNNESQVYDFCHKLTQKTNAKFVKIKAKNFGILPSWHQGSGGEAFIFIDEITVK